MNNKILLITSSFEDELRSPEISMDSHYPIGLSYIYSYLESQEHIMDLLFINDYTYEDCYKLVKEKLAEFQPEYVGIQMLTANRVSSYKIIEYIHTNYPDIKIFTGGVHSTVMYEQILKKYPYLYVVLGEGEITCAKLIEALNDNGNLNNVEGIAFNQNGEIVVTKPRPLIEDLDSLPFPKHEIYFHKDRTKASLLTTRGCPFSCTFCCLKEITRKKVRYRSISNVISEIEYLINNFPNLETVWIHDDTFFLDNQRVIEFCDEIVKRNIKLKFICSGRLKPVSIEMAKALEKAGFHEVLFGLESGSAEVLKNCKKNITKQDAINAIQAFKDTNINIATFLIIGLPGETEKTIDETIELIHKLQKIKYIPFAESGPLLIYPGTEIYELAKEKGIIDDNYWLSDGKVPFYTVEHSEKALFKLKKRLLNGVAMGRFFTIKGFWKQKNMIPTYLLSKEARELIKLQFLWILKNRWLYRLKKYSPLNFAKSTLS